MVQDVDHKWEPTCRVIAGEHWLLKVKMGLPALESKVGWTLWNAIPLCTALMVFITSF